MCPWWRMILSSKIQSSRPLTRVRGPLCRMVSSALLTSESYDWVFLIRCRIKGVSGAMRVGWVARMEKNFELSKI